MYFSEEEDGLLLEAAAVMVELKARLSIVIFLFCFKLFEAKMKGRTKRFPVLKTLKTTAIAKTSETL